MEKTGGVKRGTGRERKEWFELLDRWGAAGRPYRETATWLTDEHGLSRWWAQKLIVEYEQERGLRAPGVRPDGTFEVGASRTVAVPVERLFDAFVDTGERGKWLRDGKMSLRSSRPHQSARFDWQDGSTRVSVTFLHKGGSKSNVSVAHQKIPDVAEAEATKVLWKQRLAGLKSFLEA